MADSPDTSTFAVGEANPRPVAQPRGGSAHPTKLVLRALEAALCGQPVPRTLDSPQDRGRIQDIQREQLDAGWRQLRSRYPSVIMAARELHTATDRASRLVDDLLAAHDNTPAYGPARLALVSTITRRLIVDGIAVARGAVNTCRNAITETGSVVSEEAPPLPTPRDPAEDTAEDTAAVTVVLAAG